MREMPDMVRGMRGGEAGVVGVETEPAGVLVAHAGLVPGAVFGLERSFLARGSAWTGRSAARRRRARGSIAPTSPETSLHRAQGALRRHHQRRHQHKRSDTLWT